MLIIQVQIPLMYGGLSVLILHVVFWTRQGMNRVIYTRRETDVNPSVEQSHPAKPTPVKFGDTLDF